MYFAECRVVDTRQSRLCRVSRGGTRQRSEKQSLPSAPGWHSAKKAPLPSAADLALGKPYFKNKKNLCRVPHRGHSAKNINLANPTASPSSLSHSRSLAARRRRPRSLAADPAPAPTLAAGHAPPPALRPLARAARALPARPRAAHDRRRPRADDLHAVDRSRPPRRHARSPSCTVHAEQIGIN